MPVPIPCPKCGKTYDIPDEKVGKLGRCKPCGTTFPLVPPSRDGGPPPFPLTDLDADEPEPPLPESIGKYLIRERLGRGAMGEVFRAFDPGLKREVALKRPLISDEIPAHVRARFLRRFRIEAEAAARFHHPNFCTIFTVEEADNLPFLTMALIDGKPLADSIEWGQGWEPRKAVDVIRQLALALDDLHAGGIVHRDLKPGNIMVKRRGDLVIVDFGMAQIADDEDQSRLSHRTQAGQAIGTPSYMSPEQADVGSEVIGPGSDLYSLGVILFELLTGRLPFEGPPLLVLSQVVYADPPSLSKYRSGLDPALEKICMRALAKKPGGRHPSMADFAAALQEWLDGPAVDPDILINSLGMKLKLIPAGEFMMGAADGEPGAQEHEKPRHRVRITRPFYLGVYPVTQAEYHAVIGKNPSAFSSTGARKERVTGLETSRFPVESVSWLEAVLFCNKLSEREGLKPCYFVTGELMAGGTGYRLPTEAEWEYGCRAGSPKAFSFGDRLSTTEANFDGNSTYNGSSKGTYLQRPSVVGSYPANGFGLHDMHGNVWEWCSDYYDEKYYASSPVDDPMNSAQAAFRVRRGGCWDEFPQGCRSALRFRRAPDFRRYDLGFRVVRVRPGS